MLLYLITVALAVIVLFTLLSIAVCIVAVTPSSHRSSCSNGDA